MATVKFMIQGTKDVQNIYLRLSIDTNTYFKRKSGYSIIKGDWKPQKGEPKQNTPDLKNLKSSLDRLRTYVNDRLNVALDKKEAINGDWLQNVIDTHHGKSKEDQSKYLVNYFERYKKALPLKPRSNGKVGMTEATRKKVHTVSQKVIDFERYKKKRFTITDVNKAFADDFVMFLREKQQLSLNTIGTYIKYLKTICIDAKLNGYEVNYQVQAIKGFSEKTEKITLSFDEIDQIELASMPHDYLDNARNWLVLGCNLGQRVSDLLRLDTSQMMIVDGVKMLQITQQKTGKLVSIPINEQAQRILDKNRGQFPRKISDVKLNKYIKTVCEVAGITDKVKGSKLDPVSKRKETGAYPKYELITSHICRRSFATNYYGIIPTPYLKDITAHSTERQFLEYVGKSANESAYQVAQYMAILTKARQDNGSHLKVV